MTGPVAIASGQAREELALPILQSMSLVDHQVGPLNRLEPLGVHLVHHKLVLHYEDVEVPSLDLSVEELLPLRRRPLVDDRVHRWGPSLEFILPVGQGGEGSDNHEGTILMFLLDEVSYHSDHLHCLAQTHLIRKNPAQIVVIQIYQPIHPFDLIRFQLQALISHDSSLLFDHFIDRHVEHVGRQCRSLHPIHVHSNALCNCRCLFVDVCP
mmetsp:Transcript_22218/g.73122  ORF Transcript_22218/g.73122 Transcript_22218/m.73122 type:complete len:211 (-) Transcript_22218:152-784(-)